MKVAFIEGRPNSHPTHALYAKSVNADFFHVDRLIKYHENPKSSKFRQLFSWLVNALFFPNKKKYDKFLTEEPYLSIVLMKKLGLISSKQKIVSILGSHTLYFLHTKKYSKFTKWFLIYLLNSYDSIICIGTMQKELLDIYVKNKNIKIFNIFNGIPTIRFNELYNHLPNLEQQNILTIAGVQNEDRMFYKGIDLMLDAFAISFKDFPYLTYTIVGEFDEDLIKKKLDSYQYNVRKNIYFVGLDYDLIKYIRNSSLYLHTARGEAWGVSVTEAMLGGIPSIVSEWTGSKDIVNLVDKSFVLPLNSHLISKKINDFFELTLDEKKELSVKFKEASFSLTEEIACKNFKNAFEQS